MSPLRLHQNILSEFVQQTSDVGVLPLHCPYINSVSAFSSVCFHLANSLFWHNIAFIYHHEDEMQWAADSYISWHGLGSWLCPHSLSSSPAHPLILSLSHHVLRWLHCFRRVSEAVVLLSWSAYLVVGQLLSLSLLLSLHPSASSIWCHPAMSNINTATSTLDTYMLYTELLLSVSFWWLIDRIWWMSQNICYIPVG